jgi:hypothetical protein
MPTATTVLSDLEDAVLERLATVTAQTFQVDDDWAAVRCPAVNVGLVDVPFRSISSDRRTYRVDPLLHVHLMVANLRDERSRRRDSLTLATGVASLLSGWRPTILQNGADVALPFGILSIARVRKMAESAGRMMWRFEVSTTGSIVAATDAEVEMMVISLQYLLTPNSDPAEAADLIDLSASNG